MLVSCTSESLEVLDSPQSQGQGAPVQFTYTIDDRADSVLTRAVLDTLYLRTGSKVGIYALQEKKNDDGSYNVMPEPRTDWVEENIRLNYNNACYEAENKKRQVGATYYYTRNFIPSEGTQRGSFPTKEGEGLRFFAYYPYTSQIIYDGQSVPRVPVDGTAQDAQLTDDYLYTEPVHATAADGVINLRFKHVMSQVAIHVRTTNATWKSHWLKAPQLSKVTLYTAYQKGYFTLGDGVFKPEKRDISMLYAETSTLLSEEYECVARFLVFPQNGVEKDESTLLGIDIDIAEPLRAIYHEYKTPSTINVFEMGEQTISITKGKVTNVYLTINKIE